MLKLMEMDVKFVKGIGPQRAKLLADELGIHTAYDLLHHFPSHYIDRSNIYPIRSLTSDMPYVQIRGRFVSFNDIGEGAKRRRVGLLSDGTGAVEVVWFNRIKQIRELYSVGTEYIVFGKPSEFGGHWNMVHPEIDLPGAATASQGLRGVYPLTDKLRSHNINSRSFHTWIQSVLATLRNIADPLPSDTVASLRLMAPLDALNAIHNPQDNDSLQRARLRLKFEELFLLQLNIRRFARTRGEAIAGIPFARVGEHFNNFYFNHLPFPLTEAQKRVIKEIRADMGSGRQMNRLLQGDVGSGKTLVALLCMLIALDNDTQACMMAPTEILAAQHYETLRGMLAPIGVNVRLLTGSTPKRQRDIIQRELTDGSLHILIGTHALIEDKVQFRRLGFAVIDEQHRFGVAQRARLWAKGQVAPHVLVMTATPIPRTLAMTVYGDLEVSVIDELPPGRKPIQTVLRYEDRRFDVYRAIGAQLAKGRQAYIVYPLVKESEKLDLKSVEAGYENIKETFPSYNVALVHGKQKPAVKDHQMDLFASGKAQILVATTVIEVGVNVPNATTMVIENAERFGLSQLHQLRGRVGRGEGQSYCVLMTKHKIAAETRKRLELMTETTDGFRIAEADLKWRGPGDIEGTMQSGIAFNLHIANLASDGQIVQLARDKVEPLLDADPTLSLPANAKLRRMLEILYPRTIDFSRIS